MRTVRLAIPLLGAALLVVCWRASEASLERQIAGDTCDFESRYPIRAPELSEHDEPRRCVRREFSVWNWLAPPLEAVCQEHAARCAAHSKDVRYVPALVRALREERDEHDTGDGTIFVRAEFAKALGVLRDEPAIEPLIEVLRSSKIVARAAAAEALGRFGSKARAAGPELVRASSTPNPQRHVDVERLRNAAAVALARIEPAHAWLAFSPVLRTPFADLDATERALRGMAASASPLPAAEASLLELVQQLPERMNASQTDAERSATLFRICTLVASELRRRGRDTETACAEWRR